MGYVLFFSKVQTLSCLTPLKQNLSGKMSWVIGHWQEKMIERAGISVTVGDAQEEEAEVFQGVEVVVDRVVANPPSVLVVFYILCQHPFFVNVVTLYKLVHFPGQPSFGSFSCHSLSEENSRTYSNMRKSSVECFSS